MKLTLTLVIVSLSVLTAAKLEFARKHKDHHHHECGNHTTHSGSTTYPGTPSQSPSSTPSQSPAGTPSIDGTPATSLTPSGTPSPQVRVATTTQSGGYVQNPKGNASFTAYSGCQYASCGQRVSGYSAAVNQLAFGAASGAGGACGRCFKISANYDPYTPSYTGPWGETIVVKVNDLCPATNNNVDWCAQTVSHPLNAFNEPMHFDLCTDSGAPAAFFPGSRRAMLGTYEEVSCSEWSGSDGEILWNGSCLLGESAPLWPAAGGCSNTGTPPA